MRALSFVVGGCVYRMHVSVHHMLSVASLVGASVARQAADERAAHRVHSFDYAHTSNLPQGRSLWLRRCIETDADLAISIDSDTEFNPSDLYLELERVQGSSVAIGCAPVAVGDTGLCNLNRYWDGGIAAGGSSIGEIRLDQESLAECLCGSRMISSGGFGLAVFNLQWFRNNWREPEPERASIHTGEDLEMCYAVRRRGGMIAALKVRTHHHAFSA